MPISGRNLREAGIIFRDHLQNVLSKTISEKPVVFLAQTRNKIEIGYRDRGVGSSTSLRSKFGSVDFYIGYLCDAVEDENTRQVNLRINEYAYALRPHKMDEPLFRWEYVRSPELNDQGDPPEWCRHHLQGDVILDLIDDKGAAHRLPLNAWHLPTGRIAVEEVIRFCIVDLGVRPKAGWQAVLAESYAKFKAEYSKLDDG